MGHRIAQLSELDADTLIEIVGSQFSGGAPADSTKPGIATPSKFLKASRAAVFDLDEQAFEATLNRAAATLTRPALFDEIIVPLVVEIGENWATGKLKIVNEHMASSVLLYFLRDMLSAFRPMPSMPKMIVATPVNHWHELGALIAAIIAAEAGWGVYYYGPNLPAEEIAAAALYKSASAIALSVVYLDADRHILREINRLCNFTEGLTIIVGGRGVQSYRAELKQMNVLHPLNFSEFRELIGSLVRFLHQHTFLPDRLTRECRPSD